MMRAAVFNLAAPHLAEECSAHMDDLERKGAIHDEAVAFQMTLFQATKPETFVMDWISDPTADLVEFYRAFTVHGDDECALGAACKRFMLNRMREAAEHTVSQGE
jgi:hypothetical protein